jgi:hypothetical protein
MTLAVEYPKLWGSRYPAGCNYNRGDYLLIPGKAGNWHTLLLPVTLTPSPPGVILCFYSGSIPLGYEVTMRFRFT